MGKTLRMMWKDAIRNQVTLMNELDRKLCELLGDKTLSFGCYVFNGYKRIVKQVKKNEFLLNDGARYELLDGDSCIIGHEPTIADLHRWMKETLGGFVQEVTQDGKNDYIVPRNGREIKYDSSKSFLSQSEETKLAIVNLIESYERQSLPISR